MTGGNGVRHPELTGVSLGGGDTYGLNDFDAFCAICTSFTAGTVSPHILAAKMGSPDAHIPMARTAAGVARRAESLAPESCKRCFAPLSLHGKRPPFRAFGLLATGLRDSTALDEHVQRPFLSSLSPLKNDFWNHD